MMAREEEMVCFISAQELEHGAAPGDTLVDKFRRVLNKQYQASQGVIPTIKFQKWDFVGDRIGYNINAILTWPK